MRTILLVGNESEDLLRFEETLNRYDYAVIRSTEDLSGLCRTGNDPDVDLIIADCRMPGRDGLELLSALRQRLPAIPVVLLAARSFKADSKTTRGQGTHLFIVKQVTAGNLERIVTAILTGIRQV